MNTMEVLTLLLVVFAALSYIDRHGDDNNKKKYHPLAKVDAISFLVFY